jgi:gamma-glutamyltranspeptidase/glutathione hydrolase
LADLLAPAIHHAEAGVPVAPRVAFDWARATHLRGAARDHYLLGSQAPRVGQIFRAPGQAEVLRRIAREGRAGFYEGEVAQDMLDSLRALGGTHTADDFAATRATWGDPIEGQYRGLDLLEHAPNGQGATANLILNILSHFDLAALDPLGPERAHLEAEATKLGYDARNRIIADPDFTTRLAHMLAPETAAKLAALIDPAHVLPDVAPLTEEIHRDTVLLTVVDRDRMAVTLIYSIFHPFGSGMASNKFGLIFQNRGAGFNLTAGHPNELAGGKRPMHTIIPAMLRDQGRITIPFGVMGGAYQPVGHARFVSNLRDYAMTPQDAIDAPRSFTENGTLTLETSYPDATAAALATLGHKVARAEGPIGGAQAIDIGADGVLIGASDPRKDGCALGY